MSTRSKTVEVHQMKCAHPECNCVVDLAAAVEHDGRLFCDEQCAAGAGCGHRWCGCGSMTDEERYRHEAAAK